MTRDIDRIIELVRIRLPDVEVVQMHKTHPADDDGLWWFELPNIMKNIQLESTFGVCPFIVETHDMKSSTEAWYAQTVDEAADAVVEYLAGLRARGDSVA